MFRFPDTEEGVKRLVLVTCAGFNTYLRERFKNMGKAQAMTLAEMVVDAAMNDFDNYRFNSLFEALTVGAVETMRGAERDGFPLLRPIS